MTIQLVTNDKEFLKLSDARKVFFVTQPSVRLLKYWIKNGMDGVKLEAIKCGNPTCPRYYISQFFVNRFLEAITNKSMESIAYRGDKTDKSAYEAMERMKKRGWYK